MTFKWIGKSYNLVQSDFKNKCAALSINVLIRVSLEESIKQHLWPTT